MIEVMTACADHPTEEICNDCLDGEGRYSCHHNDHEDYCPHDTPPERGER